MNFIYYFTLIFLHTKVMTPKYSFQWPLVHLSLCDCCAVKVHTKDMPKKHKILNYIVPIRRTSQEEVEALWRGWWCSGVEDLSIRVWGGLGQRRDVLEVKDSKMWSGRVTGPMWQSPSLRLFKQEHNKVIFHGPVKPSYTLCGPLLPDPVPAELPTLTVSSFPGQEHRFIGGEIAF